MKKIPVNAGDVEIVRRVAPNAKFTMEAGGIFTPSLVQFAHLSFSEWIAFEKSKSVQAGEAMDALNRFYITNR